MFARFAVQPLTAAAFAAFGEVLDASGSPEPYPQKRKGLCDGIIICSA